MALCHSDVGVYRQCQQDTTCQETDAQLALQAYMELQHIPHRSLHYVKRITPHGTVAEHWSPTGNLSLSCTWDAADGWPLMWV